MVIQDAHLAVVGREDDRRRPAVQELARRPDQFALECLGVGIHHFNAMPRKSEIKNHKSKMAHLWVSVLAFCAASSTVPTYIKASSGNWSQRPSQICLTLSIVSATLTYLPSRPVN